MYKQQSNLLRFFSKPSGGGPNRNTHIQAAKDSFVSTCQGPSSSLAASSSGASSNDQNQRKRHADSDLPCQPHPTKRTEISRKEKIKEKLAGGGSEEQSFRYIGVFFEPLEPYVSLPSGPTCYGLVLRNLMRLHIMQTFLFRSVMRSFREVQKRFEWLTEKNIRDGVGRRPSSKV